MFDRNGDGTISVEELGSILRALGQNPTQAQVNDFMKKADKNGELFFLSFQSNTCTVNFYFKGKANHSILIMPDIFLRRGIELYNMIFMLSTRVLTFSSFHCDLGLFFNIMILVFSQGTVY